MMTNIVFIKYHLTKFGGLEKHSFRIIKKFISEGYKVTLLTTKISKDLDFQKNLNLVIFKPSGVFNFLKLKIFDIKCSRWLKKNPSELIFSLDRSSVFTHARLGNGLHLSFLKNRKFYESKLKTFFNKLNPKNLILLNMEKKGLLQNNLKKIIVNSNMVKTEILNHFRISNTKIKIIPNGVEFDKFEPFFIISEKERLKILKNLNLAKKNYQFLFIGNDYKRKGLNFLLQALYLLENKNFHLSIIGKDKNIKKFEKVVKKMKLEKNVTFFGPRNDVIKFYQIADSLVLPSFYDPFSNVVLEALSMGIFVITSFYNGAKEVINEKNGLVIDILNPNKFVKSLKIAMKTKKNITSSTIIRETIKNFTFEKQLKDIIENIKNES